MFDLGLSRLPLDRALVDSDNFEKYLDQTFFTSRSKKVFHAHSFASSVLLCSGSSRACGPSVPSGDSPCSGAFEAPAVFL